MNLCDKLLVQRAGTNIEHIKHHDPSWIELEVPEDLLNNHFVHITAEIVKI